MIARKKFASMAALFGLVGTATVGLLLITLGHAQETPIASQPEPNKPSHTDQLERARQDVARLQAEVQKRLEELEKATERLQQLQPKPDRGREVVATLYDGKIRVTRAELGEYLIARHGAERLEFMLNRKIIEIECRKHDITVTDAEVEQRFLTDLRSLDADKKPLTKVEFVNNVLRRFGKTEYEWREDVIRPKLMVEKLVRAEIELTDDDVRDAFESRYGPKVEVRMIVFDKGNAAEARRIWLHVSKGRAPFIEEARRQSNPDLAAAAGKVPPVHKQFGDKKIEDAAFQLKEGEVSRLLDLKDGTCVILLCEKHVPADKLVRFEDVREKLSRELHDQRVAARIPEVFAELRMRAAPKVMLEGQR